MGNSSSTLFVLVTAMLVYRTIDLLSVKQKLEQIAKKAPCAPDGGMTYAQKKRAARAYGVHARTVLRDLRVVMWLRKEFFSSMMGLYLVVFSLLGYSVLYSKT